MRLDSMPTHVKVCHGDYNPSNIIITPEGKPFVLDWSHATQGNASADVARTYLLFKLEKKDSAGREIPRPSSAARPTPPSSMCSNGCRSSPLRSRSRAGRRSASSCSRWTNVVDYE